MGDLLAHRQLAHLLLVSVLLSACASAPRRSGPSSELRLDTEKAGLLRHPSLRAAHGAATPSATRAVASELLRLAPVIRTFLSEGAALELNLRLVACAREAERHANEPLFGDRSPTRDECRQQVGVDQCGRPITRAMELGRQKHALALACARKVLEQHWPSPFSIEQRYRFYRAAKVVETVSPAEEQRLLDENCTGELWRTIKPDIVLHPDFNLLRAVLILDFKFPCPDTNEAQWTRYGSTSAYSGDSQDEIYQEALGGEALLLSPRGIFQ